MMVVSKIKRKEGHHVALGKAVYEFRPPEYAADVTDEKHLDCFRAVPEGYVIEERAKPGPKPKLEPVKHANSA